MPIFIVFFIAHCVSSFKRQAIFFVIIIIIFEVFSNFISIWYAYGVASTVERYIEFSTDLGSSNDNFYPLWRLVFSRSPWSADKACIAGVLLGCFSAFYKLPRLRQMIFEGKLYIEYLLTKIFSSLTPIFILGFTAQIYQSHLVHSISVHYSALIILLIIFLMVYIFALLSWSVDGSLEHIISNFRNLLPAALIALTSGCSLTTMPWTIAAVRRNLKYPQMADAIIPTTTNIQQIGDCIANAFLCFLIFKHFYGHPPDLITWFNFSVVFVLMRFATIAVLGGAIFMMLPIYETYLNFNSEMIAIILTLNIILNPIITLCNVLANAALCCIFEKIYYKCQLLIWGYQEYLGKKMS